MGRTIRVCVLGGGCVARQYADAVQATDGLQVDLAPDADAFVLACGPRAIANTISDAVSRQIPMVIDPHALLTSGSSKQKQAWARVLKSGALVALPWRTSPVVRFARELLPMPTFMHAHVYSSVGESVRRTTFHVIDLVLHLMRRSPDRMYAETGCVTTLNVELSPSMAGTIDFGDHGSAAFVTSSLAQAPSTPPGSVLLTAGMQRVVLSASLSQAEVVGFTDDAIESVLSPDLRRDPDNPNMVRSEWALMRGIEIVVSGLAGLVRSEHPLVGMPNLDGGLRTAALVRAAYASEESGRPRRLVAR